MKMCYVKSVTFQEGKKTDMCHDIAKKTVTT